MKVALSDPYILEKSEIDFEKSKDSEDMYEYYYTNPIEIKDFEFWENRGDFHFRFRSENHKYLEISGHSWIYWDLLETGNSYGVRSFRIDCGDFYDKELNFDRAAQSLTLYFAPETEEEYKFISFGDLVVQPLKWQYACCIFNGVGRIDDNDKLNKISEFNYLTSLLP